MKLIDIGINLTHPSFDRDREAVIQRAANAGVAALIITGTGVKASLEAQACVKRYPQSPCGLYFTAGIHPHEADTLDEPGLETLRRLGKTGAVAIGECGLDYFRDYVKRPLQRRCFERHLALAADLGLPLFLHERDSFEDFYPMLKDFMLNLKGAVVHCFTGGEKELEAYLDLGCHIGITGWICDERRGRHLEALVKKIPAPRLMLETDAPFLIPRNLLGKRPQRNEPRYLPHIAAAVARHQNKDPAQVARETRAATLAFFGIPDQ